MFEVYVTVRNNRTGESFMDVVNLPDDLVKDFRRERASFYDGIDTPIHSEICNMVIPEDWDDCNVDWEDL